jgi:hypothetical protein
MKPPSRKGMPCKKLRDPVFDDVPRRGEIEQACCDAVIASLSFTKR